MTISVRAALGAGFRLIAREPLAFLVWCGAFFLVNVLPTFVMLDALAPFMTAYVASGGDPTDPALIAAQEQMGRYSLLQFLSAFVTVTVIPGAVFRAILRPDERRFFYLGVGAREGWLGLSMLAIFGLSMLGSAIVLVPAGMIAALVGPLATLVMAAATAIMLWGLLRVSFSPVMSFSDHAFRLTESWRATKGQVGRLLLTGVGLFVLVFAAYVIVASAVMAALGVDALTDAQAAAWRADPVTSFRQLGVGRLAALFAVLTVFSTWSYVMGAAAWASMYRDLKASPP